MSRSLLRIAAPLALLFVAALSWGAPKPGASGSKGFTPPPLLKSVVKRLEGYGPTTPPAKKSRFSFAVTNVRTYWFGIVPTGLDLKLDYRIPPIIPGVATILEMTAGGGYEQENFWRNKSGVPITNPNYATAGPGGTDISIYNRVQAISDLGIRQGILYSPKLDRNVLEAFAFYRFHYGRYLPNAPGELIFNSPFPDRNGILSNSVMAGLDYNTLTYDKVHKTYKGIYAETSIEWGPRFFLNNIGDANFLRWNFTGNLFRTLYTSSNGKGMNRFSLYAGDHFAADYATGSSIPIYVQQSFGGRVLTEGLGGDSVRGFEVGAWGTQLKLVNNLEIRAVGPAILFPSVAPGLYAFFDSGYYNGYFHDPANTPGGFLASVGAGVYLVSLDLADVTALIAFPVYGQRIDRAPYNVTFHFSLQF